MKLDATILRLLGKDEFRVLRAIEMGQRNVRLLKRMLDSAVNGKEPLNCILTGNASFDIQDNCCEFPGGHFQLVLKLDALLHAVGFGLGTIVV